MRGRKPAGPEIADRLPGGEEEKKRVKAILETVAGVRSVKQASRDLGISPQRFHELRQEFLDGGLAALRAGAPGRPAHRRTAEAERVALLEQEVAELHRRLALAQVQAEIALALPGRRQRREKKSGPGSEPGSGRRRRG